METYAPIAILLALGATVYCWNLRLEWICEAGEPSGTNHTLVHADTFLGCAGACDFNPNCYYLSLYGTDCVMYEDVSPCNGTNVGPTRDAYQVDSRCEPGWHRFGGSCYLVDQFPNGVMAMVACNSYAANHVIISTATKGVLLVRLLQSLNVSETTVLLGATRVDLDPFQWWDTGEPFVYENWDDGEPSNITTNACVGMTLSNAKWKVEDCDLLKISVCEKPLLTYM